MPSVLRWPEAITVTEGKTSVKNEVIIYILMCIPDMKFKRNHKWIQNF